MDTFCSFEINRISGGFVLHALSRICARLILLQQIASCVSSRKTVLRFVSRNVFRGYFWNDGTIKNPASLWQDAGCGVDAIQFMLFGFRHFVHLLGRRFLFLLRAEEDKHKLHESDDDHEQRPAIR